jgi:serine/threonine-protein kinase
MLRCPACTHEYPSGSRFCPSCAAPVDVTSAETEVLAAAANAGTSSRTAPRLTSSSSVDEGRFLPGVVLAGRYRIAGLLGRGGMGEVYRATDLTLGQAVALKFLPEGAAGDERALARFFNEVRMARQVTHPNVCRVYDIGEIEGVRYISMEYVDGEDLAVLLRRIGRLPADKAIEIARKLCAGLAAAHEKGVLHRDLKPANIMIDGRGQVVIMDFGLAGLGEQLQGDVRSGTPAYMSPEQLAGTEVTTRSDIYALGLVLYELFTGKRAFEAASLMELIEMQQRGTPASVTSVVKDLDPAVERAIQHCLDPDPRRRPSSALTVVAALPGGDPLAAALAAGETPSPDLVAAAGKTEGLRPVVAVSWLAASIAAIVAVTIVGARWSMLAKVSLDLPPEALARDARLLLKDVGYTGKPGDAVGGFEMAPQYSAWLEHHTDVAAARWKNPAAGYPPLVNYSYRESPSDLVPKLGTNTVAYWSDPPFDRAGMVRLKMGADGRLLQLEAVPPQLERVKPASGAMDWSKLFRAAGIDFPKFQTAEPHWIPLAGWDERTAWTGPSPGTPSFPIRVEAAAWRGKPVYFRVVGPWSTPDRENRGSGSAQQFFELAIIYSALIASGVIAWHNVRLGRGDRHGAWVLFLLYFASFAGARLLWARHTPSIEELNIFWSAVMIAGLNGGVAWLFYLALEPWVRRGWPQTMISWSRFTTKGIRDVLVGRDLLLGTGIGAAIAAVVFAKFDLHGAGAGSIPLLGAIQGVRWNLGEIVHLFEASLFDVLLYTFILFVVRLVLRKESLVAAVFILVAGAINSFGTTFPTVDWPANLLVAAIFTAVMLRLGLLAAIVSYTTYTILYNMPRTLDFSSWYAGLGMIPVVLLIGVAWYGFRLSLAGRKVLRSELL